MKTCPFCGATIEENARFCLYCMTSLEEKQTVHIRKTGKGRKTAAAVAVAVFAVLFVAAATAGLLWLSRSDGDGVSSSPEVDALATAFTTTTASAVTDAPSASLTIGRETQTTVSAATVTTSDGSVTSGTTQTALSTTRSTSTQSTDKTAAVSSALSTTVGTLSTAPSTTATLQSPTYTPVAWCVRAAFSFDYDERYNHVAPEDAVVIVGLMSIPDDGVYVIPETIDGKTVVAVDFALQQGYAFGDAAVRDTVKAVYLPPSLTTLCADAFSGCSNLTDVYAAGEYLYAEPSAFPSAASRNGTLTFHTTEEAWCLYGSAPFSVYCSAGGVNGYEARWQSWSDSLYGEEAS